MSRRQANPARSDAVSRRPATTAAAVSPWGAGAILAAALILAACGWRLFFFLTDDAHIAFRYVSNWKLGHGLGWNPPPFIPVEGYTSFLWVVLLRLVWAVTGIEPPEASNILAFIFGLGTIGLVYRMLMSLPLPPLLARRRLAFLGLVLLATVTNRTFLAWLSSGLETAMFNFWLTLWIALLLAAKGRPTPRRLGGLAAAAAAASLTRPDGLLLVLATLAVLALEVASRLRAQVGGSRGGRFALLIGSLPLLVVPFHLLWRHAIYGEWLPNTYYAKSLGAWPQSGVRYAAAFVLEYGLLVWIAMALIWLIRRHRLDRGQWLVGGVLAAHFVYYTLITGGDHFEFRVLSHLIPLAGIFLVWFAADLGLRPAAALGVLGLWLISSWPIPWTHYAETRHLTTRAETLKMVRPIAGRFPPGLRLYAQAFDDLQAWLIEHSVCTRHQEHKVFHLHMRNVLPTRAEGAKIAWSGRPVVESGTVGVLAWVLPHVAVIDLLGLNDYAVARFPPPKPESRQMAHDRLAPVQYAASFRPNIDIRNGVAHELPRAEPLTDADIVRLEREWRHVAEAIRASHVDPYAPRAGGAGGGRRAPD